MKVCHLLQIKKYIKKYSDRIKQFWLQLKVHWRLDINKNKAFHSKNAKTKGAGMFFPLSTMPYSKSCKSFLGQCTVACKWNFYCSSCFCAGKEQWEAINGNIKLPSREGQQQEADQYGRFWFVRLLWRCLQHLQMSVQSHKKRKLFLPNTKPMLRQDLFITDMAHLREMFLKSFFFNSIFV